uniref:Uncharacterized protein n=1 Tax=Cacopsylla melanoneura TaxID=428564 RepID=A0A8D8ZTM5_9HEMI
MKYQIKDGGPTQLASNQNKCAFASFLSYSSELVAGLTTSKLLGVVMFTSTKKSGKNFLNIFNLCPFKGLTVSLVGLSVRGAGGVYLSVPLFSMPKIRFLITSARSFILAKSSGVVIFSLST